jgi:DNA-binding GntR family transcriptional regulator
MASTPRSLDRRTTSEEVASRLRQEILRAELRPGTRLRQGAIAARFGVSTTPVREAFALLQAEGLVRIDPHRGAVVFLPSVADLREYYEIREALEGLAIALALPNLDDALLDELQALINRMKVIEDPETWASLNGEFHHRLYEPSGRPRLLSLIGTLRDASSAYIRLYVARQLPGQRSDADHQRILDACRARDVERTRAALAHHLRHVAEELARFITLPDAPATEATTAHQPAD